MSKLEFLWSVFDRVEAFAKQNKCDHLIDQINQARAIFRAELIESNPGRANVIYLVEDDQKVSDDISVPKLGCANRLRDASCESSVVVGLNEWARRSARL